MDITVDGVIQDFLGAKNGRQSDGKRQSHDPYSKQGYFSSIISYSTTGFARSQNKVDALHGCPTIWKSQLQKEIALSSYVLSEALLIMERLMEMWKREVKVVTKATTKKCNVYKDKSEDTEKVVRTHKYRYSHEALECGSSLFRSDVRSKEVTIHAIDTTRQLADYLTNLLMYRC